MKMTKCFNLTLLVGLIVVLTILGCNESQMLDPMIDDIVDPPTVEPPIEPTDSTDTTPQSDFTPTERIAAIYKLVEMEFNFPGRELIKVGPPEVTGELWLIPDPGGIWRITYNFTEDIDEIGAVEGQEITEAFKWEADETTLTLYNELDLADIVYTYRTLEDGVTLILTESYETGSLTLIWEREDGMFP